MLLVGASGGSATKVSELTVKCTSVIILGRIGIISSALIQHDMKFKALRVMIRLNVKVKYDLEYDMQRNLKAWEQRFTLKLKVKYDLEYDMQRNLKA